MKADLSEKEVSVFSEEAHRVGEPPPHRVGRPGVRRRWGRMDRRRGKAVAACDLSLYPFIFLSKCFISLQD